MLASRRRALTRALLLVVGVGSVLLVMLPEPGGPTHSEDLHALLYAACFAAAAGLGFLRLPPRPPGTPTRRDIFLVGALFIYAAGWFVWAVLQAGPGEAPSPSGADVLWLLLYPGALVTVYAEAVALTRSRRAFVLDLALGTAGVGAAVLAFSVGLLAWSAQNVQFVLVHTAYVGADIALFLLAFQVLALTRFRAPRRTWIRAVAFLVFAVSDAVYVRIVAEGGEIPVHGPAAAGWIVAIVLLAASIGPEAPRTGLAPPRWSLFVVPTVGTLLALAVLVSAPAGEPGVARWLAAIAILLAAVRMGVAVDDAARLHGSHEMALTDELTGLRNRRGFFDAAARCRPGAQALVLLDLDRFKEVNDTFGHASGDALLAVVARRLGEASHGRPDAEPDVVARLGGDEFAVRVAVDREDRAMDAAARMAEAVCSRYDIDGMRLRVEASAGVAFDPDGTVPVSEMLRRADVAMYAAKAGEKRVEAFRPGLDVASPEDFARRDARREAFTRGGLRLHFQPQVELASGRVVGAEALARLATEDGGLVLPGDFLPDLARTGRLGDLTTQVVDLALAQAGRWLDAGTPVPVAVNVPAEALALLDATVRRGLVEHRVPPALLCLEITEAALVRDRAMAARALAGLRALGVRVSIDDYGTGYSTLSYLRELPLDELKIDRIFVRGMDQDARSRTIVESTASLAHGLGLVLVAEGVETQEDADAALAAGCDVGQGWFFARPAPAEEIDLVLTERDAAGEGASHDRTRPAD